MPTKTSDLITKLIRRAHREGGATVPMPDRKSAERLRFEIYRHNNLARKAVKSDSSLTTLVEEIEGLMVSIKGTDLILIRKDATADMQALSDFLGDEADAPVVLPELEESRKRMAQRVAEMAEADARNTRPIEVTAKPTPSEPEAVKPDEPQFKSVPPRKMPHYGPKNDS